MKHRFSAAFCAGTLTAALLPANAHAAPTDPTVEATPSESSATSTINAESTPSQSPDTEATSPTEAVTTQPSLKSERTTEARDANPVETTTEATPSSTASEAAKAPQEDTTTAAVEFPSFYYVDAKTGRALPGGTAHVKVTDTSSGTTDEYDQLVIETNGAQLASEMVFHHPDGKSNGQPVDVFDIQVIAPPAGYKMPDNSSGSITSTDQGWDSTGAIKEVAPNQFVIEMEPDAPADHTPGTKDEPLTSDRWVPPIFVNVDSKTGEVIGGSFWGGESCVTPKQGENATCENLDFYRIPMGTDGLWFTQNIELPDPSSNMDMTMEIHNRQAAPNCELITEPVWYKYDGDAGTTSVYGAGVYQLGSRPYQGSEAPVFAIPSDCNPAPICDTNDALSTAYDPNYRYGTREEDTISPVFKVGRDNSRVLSGSYWYIERYTQDADGKWKLNNPGGDVVEMTTDGSFYTRDLPLTTGTEHEIIQFHEVQAPTGYSVDNTNYVFERDGLGAEWKIYEGGKVNFDENAQSLSIDSTNVVTDPAKQHVVRMNDRNIAILDETTDGKECQLAEPSEPTDSSEPSKPSEPAASEETSASTPPSSSVDGSVEVTTSTEPSSATDATEDSASQVAGSPSGATSSEAGAAAHSGGGSSSSGSSPSGRSLANTGASILGLLVAGSALIALGYFLVAGRRRKN